SVSVTRSRRPSAYSTTSWPNVPSPRRAATSGGRTVRTAPVSTSATTSHVLTSSGVSRPRRTNTSSNLFVSLTVTRTSPMGDGNDRAPPFTRQVCQGSYASEDRAHLSGYGVGCCLGSTPPGSYARRLLQEARNRNQAPVRCVDREKERFERVRSEQRLSIVRGEDYQRCAKAVADAHRRLPALVFDQATIRQLERHSVLPRHVETLQERTRQHRERGAA